MEEVRGRYEKGQVREGIVRDVKFPNKGNVELLPLKDREEGTAPGMSAAETLRRKRLQWELPQQKWLLRLSTAR